MFVIAVCGLKGGVGKSTVAINLACALHRDGRRVLLVDVDPQGTCRAWSARAAEAGAPGPPVVSLEGKVLRRDLPRVAAGFDIVLLDSPARLGTETKAAMAVANVVLLPITPGGPDVEALDPTIALVQEVQTVRPELVAGILLNRADRTILSRGAASAIDGCEVPVLDARLGQRVAFGEAWLAGLGVVDYANGSDAAVEVRRLTRETLALGALS